MQGGGTIPPVVTFRKTAVTDPAAQALLAEYFAFRASTFPVTGGYRASYPDPTQYVEPNGVFLLAREYGEELGCGGIRSLGDGRFEIKHLWIRPLARGRGIGRRMLEQLERRALLFGAREFVLDTNSSLEAAGGLYLSHGYLPIEAYNDNPNATDWYLKSL
ncbi:hypothetical protein BH10ACT7_BH10ACT7_21490 [soil metagenome]